MRSKIYKYPMDFVGRQKMLLPKGSEVLTIQTQNNIPQMWVKFPVENEFNMITRSFAIVNTGGEFLDADLIYVNTFQQSGGAEVYHLFEER